MRPAAIADTFGVLVLTTAAALPLSCVPQVPRERQNLQPFVSAAGMYSLMAAEESAPPSPAPAPVVGCEEGCKCNGTGKEPSGDGLAVVGCRCADTCPCKAKAAQVPTAGVPVTTHGRPGWAPKNTHP